MVGEIAEPLADDQEMARVNRTSLSDDGTVDFFRAEHPVEHRTSVQTPRQKPGQNTARPSSGCSNAFFSTDCLKSWDCKG